MSRKILIYLIGVGLGCLVLMAIPGRREKPRDHPWHSQTAPHNYYPMAWVDDMGIEHDLIRQPRHLISLAPSLTEILFAMDMGDHLMAVTQWCDYPAGARELRDAGGNIGNLDSPNRELIMALKPDLILATDLTPAAVRSQLDMPPKTLCVGFRHQTVEDVLDDIGDIGTILGVPGRSVDLVQRLRNEIRTIEQRLAPFQEKPARRTLLLYGLEDNLNPGWAPGAGTWTGDLLSLCHAHNSAAEVGENWGQVSLEALLHLNPEVLIISDGRTPEEKENLRAQVAQLEDHSIWSRVEAVRKNRVFLVPPDPLSVPGPRLVLALDSLARSVWPEAFE